MHRVTEEHGLIESANGSIAKDTQPLRSTTKGSATSALTNSAFSWKFVCDKATSAQSTERNAHPNSRAATINAMPIVATFHTSERISGTPAA